MGNRLIGELLGGGAASGVCLAGSIRRRKPECGDIDLLVLPGDVPELGRWLREHFGDSPTKTDELGMVPTGVRNVLFGWDPTEVA